MSQLQAGVNVTQTVTTHNDLSALEFLVMTDLTTLREVESGLSRAYPKLHTGTKDDQLEFVQGLVQMDHLACRLERLLEAMSYCGYSAGTVSPQAESAAVIRA